MNAAATGFFTSPELSDLGRSFPGMDVPSDTELITLAGRRYRREGARDKAIRDAYGLTATRFWQLVIAILDSPTRIGALPPELWPVVKRLDEERLRRMPRAS